MSPNSQLDFDALAPDDIQKDLNQCNRSCRKMPTLGRVGAQWVVACACTCVRHDDMLTALLHWNNWNPVKRVTSAAKLAALREIRRQDKEKGIA